MQWGQLRVQYCARGHFHMPTGAARDQPTNFPTGRQPAVPPEPQLPVCLPVGEENCSSTLLQPNVMMNDCFPTRLHSVSLETEHLNTLASSPRKKGRENRKSLYSSLPKYKQAAR